MACSIFSLNTTGDVTPTINLTDMNRTAVPAAHTLLAQTMTPIPISPVMPTRTPLPFMILDGLRVVYIVDGNLYVQDSGKPAILITRSVAEDRMPLFSDDGQRIIFYRAGQFGMDSVCVINADGTQEQILVTHELLSAFGNVYDESTTIVSVAFVPGTHQLLFNTHQSVSVEPQIVGSIPHMGNDLFVVDTDTGKLKQLVTPGQGGSFLTSPNGKWVAVQALDHIDVIDVQGRNVLRSLVTYDPDGYDTRFRWAPMFWTQDSSELIIVQPAPFYLNGDLEVMARSIWRYSLDTHPGVETRLVPPPLNEMLSVSPDGNWIVYNYDLGALDPNSARGVYLGNLREGTSQLLFTPQPESVNTHPELPTSYHGWNMDSTHVIFTGERSRIYIGNIYREVTRLGPYLFAGWIDNRRYLFYWGALGEIGKQGLVRVMKYPSGLTVENPSAFVFLGHLKRKLVMSNAVITSIISIIGILILVAVSVFITRARSKARPMVNHAGSWLKDAKAP
jgi:Tol biopolymer transport system component